MTSTSYEYSFQWRMHVEYAKALYLIPDRLENVKSVLDYVKENLVILFSCVIVK